MLTSIAIAKKFIPGVEDDLIGFALQAASVAVETYCNRSLALLTKTERVNGVEGKELLLRNYPVQTVSSVRHHETLIEDFDIVQERGTLIRTCGWLGRNHTLEVTYTGGYVTDEQATEELPANLPKSIETAVILLAMTFLRTPGVTSERVGDIAVTYQSEGDNLPGPVRALLSPYVSRNV